MILRFIAVYGVLLGLLSLHSAADAHADAVAYSTYFGASNYDGAFAVVVDGAGNAYVAGNTSSTNGFPVLNPFQPKYGGGYADAFIAKFDPAGRLIFSTCFGGSDYDAIDAISLDSEGNIVLVGETNSGDLPTTPNAFQPHYGGGTAEGYGDGFIAKLTPDGSKLLYCSYFGGSGDERIFGLAIDVNGNICITGQTDSKNLPLKNALQPKPAGGDSDGFIAKFDASLTNLVFSTYLGGENRDEDLTIAVDPAGFIYVSGQTLSTNFPVTPGAFQTNHVVDADFGENWDAFVTKLKPDGSALIYSTYIGNGSDDGAFAIAVDANGSACVTGYISATWDEGTFPLGFQPTIAIIGDVGYDDAFVAKLKPDGSNFEWFTYLGGHDEDIGYGLVLDKDNNVFVTGITDSLDFPTANAPQPKFGGGTQDAFVAKISADGQRLVYSTYLGGSDEETGYAVAPDSSGNVIAVGETASINFPIRNAVQPTNAAVRITFNRTDFDAYITKLTPAIETPALKIARSGKNVFITWPTNFTGFALESTPVSAPTAMTWTPVSSTPAVIGGWFRVTQPSDVASQFFRMRRP